MARRDVLSDPMIQKIKALSRIDASTVSSDRNVANNSFMERTRVAQAKFQSLLLPEEWLDMSDAYLRLPPTLSDESFISILQVLPLFLDNTVWYHLLFSSARSWIRII
jgi:hypothetical protein